MELFPHQVRPCAQFAEKALETHDLSGIDAVEVHGVRAAGDDVVIDNDAPERYSAYFRQKSDDPVRCGDFSEAWTAQEYAAELSDRYNLPLIDHALAAALAQEPFESTEHMCDPPGCS